MPSWGLPTQVSVSSTAKGGSCPFPGLWQSHRVSFLWAQGRAHQPAQEGSTDGWKAEFLGFPEPHPSWTWIQEEVSSGRPISFLWHMLQSLLIRSHRLQTPEAVFQCRLLPRGSAPTEGWCSVGGVHPPGIPRDLNWTGGAASVIGI